MGVFRFAWKSLQFVGAALDIRDIAGLIRRGFQAAGAAGLTVAAVNWIGNNVPTLTLALGGGSLFLILLAFLPDLSKWLPHRRPKSLEEAAGESGLDTAHSKPSVFDPYTIRSQLAQVDLSGLSEPESFMMITLNVRNVSGYPVTITGVKGRIRCAGAECNSPATVEREPRQLTNSSNLVPCTIRQPLSSGMMNTVALASNLLRVSLSELEWVGSVALPQGTESLERCYIHEDFVVKGPFQQKHYASTLFRPTTTFLSSELYDSDGTPKRDD